MEHKIVVLLIAVLLIAGLIAVSFTENSIKRSIGKAFTRSSLVIKGEPVEESGAEGGSRGREEFMIDPVLIKVFLKEGESERREVRVINTGGRDLDIEVILGELERFISVRREFSLKWGKFETINLDIFGGEDAGIYTGSIIIKGDGVSRAINVVIEVKEKKPIFEITAEAIEKELKAGDNAQARLSIINRGDLRNIGILLYYAIKDFEGNVIVFKEENLVIDKELIIERSLEIPKDTAEREYVFYSRIFYEGISAENADIFEIAREEEFLEPVDKFRVGILVVLIILGLVLVALFLVLRKRK